MENKETACMENALSETERLISMFENVIKQDFSKPAKAVHIYSKPSKSFEKPTSQKVAPVKEEKLSLEELKTKVLSCTSCKLCSARKNVVFGEGCTNSPLVMVVGEGPGENEDLTGRPFVGKAGQYLDKWLWAISLSRETNTFIANIVKCRPPMNRDPESDEKQACFGYLKNQIELLRPKAILCLGKPASSMMTGNDEASMGQLRGHFYFYNKEIPMICTYHPAAVLRDLTLKRAVWEDLQKLAGFLNLEVQKAR